MEAKNKETKRRTNENANGNEKQIEIDSNVILGFVEDNPNISEEDFPEKVHGKIGGKPVWLDPENVPHRNQVLCQVCKKPMSFLLQVFHKISSNMIYFFFFQIKFRFMLL